MALADLLGYANNPFYKAISPYSNTITGAGVGLASGRNWTEGIQNAIGGAAQGNAADIAYQQQLKQEQQQTEQINRTIQFLQQKHPDLAQAVESGFSISDAFNEAFKREAGGEAMKPTSDMQEYDFAKSQGYQGTFQDYQIEMRKAGATNIDFNQNQGAAAGFADRMVQAEEVLSSPEIEAALTSVEQDLKRQAPFGMDNFLVSPDYQMADQAKRNFINAVLRRESGAVISPQEFENAEKQYFPRPGDSPEVIAQKKENRRIAIEGVTRSAGPNYAPPALTPPGVTDPYTKYGLER